MLSSNLTSASNMGNAASESRLAVGIRRRLSPCAGCSWLLSEMSFPSWSLIPQRVISLTGHSVVISKALLGTAPYPGVHFHR